MDFKEYINGANQWLGSREDDYKTESAEKSDDKKYEETPESFGLVSMIIEGEEVWVSEDRKSILEKKLSKKTEDEDEDDKDDKKKKVDGEDEDEKKKDDKEKEGDIDEEIDQKAVHNAAMSIAKKAFKGEVDKTKVDGMVKKAISLAKDTEDAIGILQGFFQENVSETANYASSILDGIPDQTPTKVNIPNKDEINNTNVSITTIRATELLL